jgi:hypothetical protein
MVKDCTPLYRRRVHDIGVSTYLRGYTFKHDEKSGRILGMTEKATLQDPFLQNKAYSRDEAIRGNFGRAPVQKTGGKWPLHNTVF